MPTYRKLVIGAGVILAAASLTVAGNAASSASPPVGSVARPTPSGSVIPDANAPHVGHVAGVQYGPNISINNHQAVHAFRVLHRGLVGGSQAKVGPALDTIHPSKGTSFNADTLGSQATQSVSRKIHAGPHTPALYTPTMFPSGGSTPGSCVEMSTAYLPGTDMVAAWDWCQAITFVAQLPIDKNFMKVYTKHHNYSTQIVQTKASPNTWTSYLYNYETGTWEKFFSQQGNSQLAGIQGWDVYELYSELKGDGQSYACDDLFGKRVEAKGIMVGVGGTLVRADPTNAGQAYDHADSEFHCDSFSYNMIKPLSHWKAIG